MLAGIAENLYLEQQDRDKESGKENNPLKSQSPPAAPNTLPQKVIPPKPSQTLAPSRNLILKHMRLWELFLFKSHHTIGTSAAVGLTPDNPKHEALTAFPFSIQLMVGTGTPIAVQRSVTEEPKVTLWDSGARRILAKTVRKTKDTSDGSL